MAAYLEKAKVILKTFERYSIGQILREENSNADALTRLASTQEECTASVPIKVLEKSSIEVHDTVMSVNQTSSWMEPILAYLKDGTALEDKSQARALRMRASRYMTVNDNLYKCSFSCPLLRCVSAEEGNYVL